MLGEDIFRSLFLSVAEIFFSALPSKIFDEVDKIEKGVDGDLVIAFGKARSRAEQRLVRPPGALAFSPYLRAQTLTLY